MDGEKQMTTKIKRMFLVAFVLLLALSFLFLFDFHRQTGKAVNEQAGTHLKELTEQVGQALQREMLNCQNEIDRVVAIVENIQNPFQEDMEGLLRELVAETNLNRFAIVTKDDVVYSSADIGEKTDDFRFKDAVFQGEKGVSDVFVSPVTGERVISVHAPIYENEEIIGGAFGTIVISELMKMVSFSGFDGEGYSYLMQSDGNTIMWTEHPNKIYGQVNFYDILNQERNESSMTGVALQEMVAQGQSGYFEYTVNKTLERCAYFMPIDFKDWYIVSIVPRVVLNARSHVFYKYAFELMLKTLAVCWSIFGVAFFLNNSQKKKLEAVHYDVLASNTRYAVAMRHTKCQVFEYNIGKDVLMNMTEGISDIVTLPNQDEIHNAKKFIEELFTEEGCQVIGEKLLELNDFSQNEDCEAQLKDGRWLRISVSAVEQKDGNHLVGTVEDITRIKEMEIQFVKEEQYFQAMLGEALSGFSLDLTNGRISSKFLDSKNNSPIAKVKFMDAKMVEAMCGVVHPDYREKITKLYTLTELERIHRRGVKEITEYYMIRLKNRADYIWVRSIIHFLHDPATGNPIIFSYVKNVDEEQKEKLELEYRSERDGLTGLYNRNTFVRKVNRLFETMDSQKATGLLIMDLDGFKSINDAYGHQVGDKLLCNVSDTLRKCADKTHCVARLGGDEFVMLLHDAESEQDVVAKAEGICRKVQETTTKEAPIHVSTISVGVAFAKDKETFDRLYPKADKALYAAKKAGKNRVSTFEEEQEADKPL